MSPKLCPRGAELFAVASHADDAFKTKLVQFFSNAYRDDQEMVQIEVLGAQHREADELFQRHKRFCEVCANTSLTLLRYAAAE
ncbi:MAG TPA: hypothetical protein VKH81_00820 [Candidatus Angelobacter sp.]|nr:hypothetical protein [Candidatus Angelobacter sp.]